MTPAPVLFVFKGAIIGFSIAAPVGPIGILCIRRSLADGRTSGLVTGLGAATADALYGAVAGFGLAVISGFLVSHRRGLAALGGLFLCYLAIRTFRSRPPMPGEPSHETGLASAYASTFILTLANPATILSFAAVFAGLGLVSAPGYLMAAALVAGVFCGSATWWLILSSAVAALRSRFNSVWMTAANRISAAILLTFGLCALVSASL